MDPRQGGLELPRYVEVFFASQEFEAFDEGDHADLAGLVFLGALDAADAANLYQVGQGDFVRQGQQDFHLRVAGHFLRQDEGNAAQAHIPRFGFGFADGAFVGPAHDHGQTEPVWMITNFEMQF